MKAFEQRRKQLQSIFQANVEWVLLSGAPFDYKGKESTDRFQGWEKDGMVYFPVEQEADGWRALSIPEVSVTRSERELIGLLLYSSSELNGSEDRLVFIKQWIKEGTESANLSEALDDLVSWFTDSDQVLSFLIVSQGQDRFQSTFQEAQQLFQSFFEKPTLLIHMSDSEWLLLLDPSIAADHPSDRDFASVESLGEALHEVIVSEMSENVTVVVDRPGPWKGLPHIYRELKRYISLGHRFRPERTVYSPRNLMLESFVDQGSEQRIEQWVNLSPSLFKLLSDEETGQTLRAFFDHDCNLSDTAKALYIHRNTLIYRLDKFRHESGWDVRLFKQAIVVQLAMMMNQGGKTS